MKNDRRHLGFTLIEIVLTLLLLGVVSVMAVSFFSKGVTRTDIPIRQLQAEANLQLVLENMLDDARQQYATNLQGLSSAIGDVGTVGTQYGAPYYVAEKQYVCPDESNTVVAAPDNHQFLLVTIRPNAASGASLTYIFGNTSTNQTAMQACGN